MTREELYQTPMFKLVKRFLMRKYPWIKDVYVNSEEDMDKYRSTLFLTLDIDARELADEKGWDIVEYADPKKYAALFNRDYFDAVYLSGFFGKDSKLEPGASDLQREIEKEMRRIERSPALPQDYELDKVFGITSFKWKFPPDNTTKTN